MLLRAPLRNDAPAIAALLAARELAAFGRSQGTLEELLAEWESSAFDPVRDAVVAEEAGGRLVGYAVAHRYGSFAEADPAAPADEVASVLLDWCERRQREMGWPKHRISIPASDVEAKRRLARRGYRLVRSNWRMTLELAGLPDTPRVPEVRLRELDPRADAAALHELDQTAFDGVAGTEQISYAAFVEEHLQARELDAGLSRVAERDGEIIGFALVRSLAAESVAYVDILAVHPREQGRGIGRTLLIEAFAAARRSGLEQGRLGVAGDNPKALRLYTGIGMRTSAQLDSYERTAEAG